MHPFEIHFDFLRRVFESYILTLVKRMAEARTQMSRTVALDRSAAVLLIAVFFSARYFLRDRLPVRVAQVGHQMLLNTVSTNGRVEPVANYQFYSPLATTVKGGVCAGGRPGSAGKLLMTLDDVAGAVPRWQAPRAA